MTTTLLPPSYPTTPPLFRSIDELIRDLWMNMDLEENFCDNKDVELTILKMRYWQSIKVRIDKEVCS